MIQKLADQKGIRFLDLNFEDIALNWTTDTADGGQHMNESGSRKVSLFLSQWLKRNYDFNEVRNESWDRSWDVQRQLYDFEAKYTDLQMLMDPLAYMQKLKDEDYTVFVATCQGAGEYWTKDLQDGLDKLTDAGIDLCENRESAYCSVSKGAKLFNEGFDKKQCSMAGTLDDGVKYSVTSRSEQKARNSIVINGMEFGGSGAGVCIVVYDKALRCVVDIGLINAHQENPIVKHDNLAYRFEFRKILMDYEAKTLTAA